jgi:hypothetical protein
VVDAARAGLPDAADVTPVAPPPSVWAAIAAVTGVSAEPRTEVLERYVAEPVRPASPASPAPPEPVTPLRAPRPRRGLPGGASLLVAAASLVLGLVAGIGGTLLLRDEPAPKDRPLAGATLAALPLAPGATGRAEVLQTPTGRQLQVDVSRLGAAQGYYEVWLIDPRTMKMYAIGVLRDGRGEWTLPEGVDLSAYPVVDVSLEPLDGNPTHSGKSVLRGTLPV